MKMRRNKGNGTQMEEPEQNRGNEGNKRWKKGN